MPSRRSALLGAAALPFLARRAAALEMPKPGKRDWAAQLPQIRVGILGGENESDRVARFDSYKALLESTFQVPVRTLLAGDYAGVVQAFAAKQVDVSIMSPSSYAAAWMESNGDVSPILTTQEEDGTISYVAAMYVRAESDIRDLPGMRGKAMAWSDPNSASGYLIPRAELREQGIDPQTFFGRTGFAGGHEQAVVAVLGGQYDAGVCWTSGQGDQAQGYTRGVLRSMVDKKLLDMSKLRIIWKSRPIPNGPVTVRLSTPGGFRNDMLAFHAALGEVHPDVFRAMSFGNGKAFVPVTHADYQVFVDMLKQEAADRRRRR